MGVGELVSLPATSLTDLGDLFAVPAVAERLERSGRHQAALRVWEELSLTRPDHPGLSRRISALRLGSGGAGVTVQPDALTPLSRPRPSDTGVAALRRFAARRRRRRRRVSGHDPPARAGRRRAKPEPRGAPRASSLRLPVDGRHPRRTCGRGCWPRRGAGLLPVERGRRPHRPDPGRSDGWDRWAAGQLGWVHPHLGRAPRCPACGGPPLREVHLSNIWAREPFRHHSLISDVAVGVVAGLGPVGYSLALRGLVHHLQLRNAAPSPMGELEPS